MRRKRRNNDFRPDRVFIQKAVAYYLKNGGKIKFIVVSNGTEILDTEDYADSFLMGEI